MSRPILVYDDDCGFCAWCVEFADARGDFEAVGFSDLDSDLRARLPDDFETCAHLVVDGSVYSCGAATEEAMARLGGVWAIAMGLFRLLPYRERIRESLYHWGASRRSWWGKLLSR
jgi:predicted DCC family thiol-disulfide oxidoreductase YuxK